MVYVIQVCWQLVSRSICSCSQAVSKPVWHIPLLCVQWKTPDDGQRNCPNYVEFHSKNKFEKLVHLVGFIMRNLSRCTVTWTSNTLHSLRATKWPFMYNLDGRQSYLIFLSVGQLARCHYPEGLVPGQLDRCLLVFLCPHSNSERVPKFQLVTSCFSCSPPNLNSSILT